MVAVTVPLPAGATGYHLYRHRPRWVVAPPSWWERFWRRWWGLPPLPEGYFVDEPYLVAKGTVDGSSN
jgi:hypothetical protein